MAVGPVAVVLPIAPTIAALVEAWDVEPVGWFFVAVWGAAAMGVVALGALLGPALAERPTRRLGMGFGFLALAGLPLLWAAPANLARLGAEHLPPAEQEALPTDVTFANLCSTARGERAFRRQLRREADALVRAVRSQPDALVTITEFRAHGENEHRELEVRELMEERLRELEDGGPGCAPHAQRRFRDVLDSPE